MTPKTVWADTRILRDAGRIAVQRGPIVYCAEGIDNGGNNLHRFALPSKLEYEEKYNADFGLYEINVRAYERKKSEGTLYSSKAPEIVETTLKLIPYNCFANRGETDMMIWFLEA